ncbi:MAG: hypothetical protein KDB22_19675 [Planctomycetales bacterium]|nr:hypothetical protein [Planctomycetales bacterium]
MGISWQEILRKRARRKKPHHRLQFESLEQRRVLAALPYGASEQDLGEFMLGSVAVTPVFLESNGQLDPSSENWSASHIDEVLGKINEGLDWWVDTLATKSTIHELSFVVDTTFATTPAETIYEPISRRSNDYSLYVTEFLTSQGFSSGNLESNIRSFNQAQREKLGTDWSYTMFVVPSVNDSDGSFAAGGSFNRAFAFAGGLFMIVPSTRPASTFAHETGHIFWARDEYIGGGNYFARRGYYNTQNDNAADNPTPGFVQQPSIMTSASLLDAAYDAHTSPASTLAMVGWQDSDGDGIFDVLDVPHRLTGAGYFASSTSTYFFSGEAIVQALPNRNSSGKVNDITLNRIREIEYRFDDGQWQLYSQPDAYSVTLDMSLDVPSNAIVVEIRARDSKTTVTSNVFSGRIGRADATLASGINGHVWIDANKNTLRDVDELGNGGWTVQLLDQAGAALALRDSIEPDDYPSGQLASNFSPDLVINSVGTDADGKVGVFDDNFVSTGTKNFRGFSRGSSSYLATWTDSTRMMQVTFSVPTSVVEIDAIGANTASFGRLEAFNSSGELIARYTSGELTTGQVETMKVSRPTNDIAFVNIGGHASTSVRLDNLKYGPETTTTTNSLGGYALPSIPPGNYQVKITPIGGYHGLQPTGDTQAVVVTGVNPVVDVDFGFETSASPWQNPAQPLDVDNDGFIAPIDVLLIVNDINAKGSRDLRGTSLVSPPYLDVNGDSFLAPIDVLLLVNFLNKQ